MPRSGRSKSPRISLPYLKKPGHTSPQRIATNEQRSALRKWWADDSLPKRDYKDAIAWWQEKFGWELKTSTCSDILSSKWAHIDDEQTGLLTKHKLTVKRNRQPKWATIEAVLIEWQIRYDNVTYHGYSSPIAITVAR